MNTLIWQIIAVLLGGAIGALCRFGLSYWVQEQTKTEFFPWGILSVNIIGCLLMGIFFGIMVERFDVGPIIRAGVFVGILGGFTTLSSFSMDTITLIYAGEYFAALTYIILSIGAGVFATALGLAIVRIIL